MLGKIIGKLMADVVDKKTRSKMMAGIRGKNTKPEITIRSLLHRRGFRFRLHDPGLPGKPDIILKRYNAIIFVHGCFWHKHDCHLFKWPETRPEFWKEKILRNVENDGKVLNEIRNQGWRVCVIWECAIKGTKKDITKVTNILIDWLGGEEAFMEITG